jgi:hypothetical protein
MNDSSPLKVSTPKSLPKSESKSNSHESPASKAEKGDDDG